MQQGTDMPIFRKLRLHQGSDRMNHLNFATAYLATPQSVRSKFR